MKLTNMEFVLLQIICERQWVLADEIDHFLKERDYKEWCHLQGASPSVALKKLAARQLVSSRTVKQGNEPMPGYAATDEGKNVLKQEIIAALSSFRESNYRFDLALTAMFSVPAEEVVAALRKRENYLAKSKKHLKAIFEFQGGQELPVNLQTLFRHLFMLITVEIEFTDILIQQLNHGSAISYSLQIP